MRYHPVTQRPDAAFQAIADPTRRAVLDALRTGGQPAGQIAGLFPMSRPAISKHLRILTRARLVRQRREGRFRVYELNPQPLRAVDRWLSAYRGFWETKLADLKRFVEDDPAPRAGGHVAERTARGSARSR